MMSSKDFSSIIGTVIGSLDEFNSGVVRKELHSIGVGMSDSFRGLFISVMSLGSFRLHILPVVTPFVVAFFLVAILKFNAFM